MTTPLRTLQDLRPGPERDRACSEALVLQLVRSSDLVRTSLFKADVALPTRSALEQRFLAQLAAAGLPKPVTDLAEGRFRLDFAWPEQRVCVETDGWTFHGHRLAFERDRNRDAELAARGWTVLRFTWRQLADEPLVVLTRLAAVLAIARTSAV